MSRPHIVVLGAGAVGCYFGGLLARAGAPVTFIGRRQHVDAIAGNGLLLDRRGTREVVTAAASTDVAAAGDADLVLLCVKTPDTETAVRALLPHLSPGAVVLSLQNGVDNIERVRSVADVDAIAAVVYVAVHMAGPGHVAHLGRGDLVIGDLPPRPGDDARKRRLEDLAALFASADIPCRVSTAIEAELWTKLMMNCAYNGISALCRTNYASILHNPHTRDAVTRVVEEGVAVARAAGVALDLEPILDATFKLADAMPAQISSTAQDIKRGKATEIDALNGYIARRGTSVDVPTPVNRTIHALVKLLEAHGADGPASR